MREQLVFFVNGRRHTVVGGDCFLSLSEFLRERLRLTGTKVVCAEGDCGSCSVLVGRPDGDKLAYRTFDSCIQLLFQLDGAHVVTVEGLRHGDELSRVQAAMVEQHGSQCGYCTPGFVVAMTGLLENCARPDENDWRCGLTGNLCRCTGYVPILAAGRQAAGQPGTSLEALYPSGPMLDEMRRLRGESLAMSDGRRQFASPITLAEAIDFLAEHPQAKLVAGATDVGVQINKRMIAPEVFLDLNRVAELEGIDDDGQTITCGARASWAALHAACADRVPEFAAIVSIFGSPQIRHAGTIGGNIVNASPIADSLPFLFVTESELELAGPQGTRTVNVTDFYHGYRQTDLRPGELLTRVRIPVPDRGQHLALYKVSRRRDLDIATFTAGVLLHVAAGKIVEARVALGAVAPTVVRARRTEAFLRGKPFDEATMQAAGEQAAAEISPISDVRGGADFRLQLTRNVFLRFFHERMQAAA
ncbi:MAG: xanthine dehydrogenase small subunit [Planctomycetota bacterium]|nr:MAG: xanthine dehydrogenase small subunit [Planctomycetota bacterium]